MIIVPGETLPHCKCGVTPPGWESEPVSITYRPIADGGPTSKYHWICVHCHEPLPDAERSRQHAAE
jgi:hypothetical protein